MAVRTDIKTVAVIGCGVIGASWAALFLARGLRVVASDPAPGALERLEAWIGQYWSTLESDAAVSDWRAALRFEADPAKAVAQADFVQENGPERLEVKRALFQALDAAAAADVIIATSSSGLAVSALQSVCAHPERILLGHPFNPPHLVPLVEVGGGKQAPDAVIDAAMAIYRRLGKHPIRMRAEVPGHVANRLQAALWREAISLVEHGVASVEDVDAAIMHGPGLRWALQGPFATLHLAGGDGGVQHALAHLGAPMESWWRPLSDTRLTPALNAKIAAGVEEALGDKSIAQLAARRDALLTGLLALKKAADQGTDNH